MNIVGFRSSVADPDVWIRPALKPDGEEYYEYALIYVDDIMIISNDPNLVMEQIKEKFIRIKHKFEIVYNENRIETN